MNTITATPSLTVFISLFLSSIALGGVSAPDCDCCSSGKLQSCDGEAPLPEGTCADFKMDGTWTFKYPSGKVRAVKNYSKGVRSGTWRLWDEQGGLVDEHWYRDGKITLGKFWRDGVLRQKYSYEDGVLMRAVDYDESGSVISDKKGPFAPRSGHSY